MQLSCYNTSSVLRIFYLLYKTIFLLQINEPNANHEHLFLNGLNKEFRAMTVIACIGVV